MGDDVAMDVHCDATIGDDVAMDVHCDATMSDDVVMDVHCDSTMSNDVAMYTCHNITMQEWCYCESLLLCITTPNYDIIVSSVNSLKLYTKHQHQVQINSHMA